MYVCSGHLVETFPQNIFQENVLLQLRSAFITPSPLPFSTVLLDLFPSVSVIGLKREYHVLFSLVHFNISLLNINVLDFCLGCVCALHIPLYFRYRASLTGFNMQNSLNSRNSLGDRSWCSWVSDNGLVARDLAYHEDGSG